MKNKIVSRILQVSCILGLLISIVITNMYITKAEDYSRNKSAKLSRTVFIDWDVPDWYTRDDVKVEDKINIVADKTKKKVGFNPNKILKVSEDNLKNYAHVMLPLYNDFTKVSESYYDVAAPELDVDAKTYEKFQCFGYNTGNRQSHLSRGSYAYTGDYNIRMVDGRALVALGTGFTTTIGQYVDIKLENGTVIAGILGDIKSDLHTDETRRHQRWDYSILEFIVDSPGSNVSDYSVIQNMFQSNGVTTYSQIPYFNSKVASVRVYDKVFSIDMNDLSNDNPDR